MSAEPDRTQTVCVLVAARNAADTIARAVNSALAQPEAAEIFVIDDGSTDDTSAVARACDDGTGRLHVRRLEVNRGPSAARNLALSMATAAYVCVLDADDAMQPGRFGRVLRQARGEDMIADDLLRITEGEPPENASPVIGVDQKIEVTLASFIAANVSHPSRPRAEWGFLKPLMRRDFIARHRLRYEETVRLGEDFLFYATALSKGARFSLVQAAGYVAVEREGSLSHAHRIEDLRALLAATDRLRARGLDAEELRALDVYRRQVAGKLHHREVLAAKRSGGMVEALRALGRSPATAGYVLGRTLEDKLTRSRP